MGKEERRLGVVVFKSIPPFPKGIVVFCLDCMNNENKYFKKNIHILRRDMIYSLILTILETAYIIYIVYNGIVLPRMRIISVLIGAHLVINIFDVYTIYTIYKKHGFDE
jgi:hypothetical protein